MSKLTDIASVEETTELARNDFSQTKPYNASVVNNTGISNNNVDNNERTTELARNDFSQTKPYNFSSL